MSAEPHERGPELTMAFGLSQGGFGTMAKLRSAALMQAPRVKRTARPTLPLDPAVTVTESPVAVAGVPFVIVHEATAPGCGRTDAEKTVSGMTESGPSMAAGGLEQTPIVYGIAAWAVEQAEALTGLFATAR
ncbi:MAG TPA: hypothetical protein VNN25_01500, partial [Thermoanaerobaculia bacterium]|nr:hypothetical protein [Thermoanaerobaculia bacterium]